MSSSIKSDVNPIRGLSVNARELLGQLKAHKTAVIELIRPEESHGEAPAKFEINPLKGLSGNEPGIRSKLSRAWPNVNRGQVSGQSPVQKCAEPPQKMSIERTVERTNAQGQSYIILLHPTPQAGNKTLSSKLAARFTKRHCVFYLCSKYCVPAQNWLLCWCWAHGVFSMCLVVPYLFIIMVHVCLLEFALLYSKWWTQNGFKSAYCEHENSGPAHTLTLAPIC